jgi:hypothetical protein
VVQEEPAAEIRELRRGDGARHTVHQAFGLGLLGHPTSVIRAG